MKDKTIIQVLGGLLLLILLCFNSAYTINLIINWYYPTYAITVRECYGAVLIITMLLAQKVSETKKETGIEWEYVLKGLVYPWFFVIIGWVVKDLVW